MSRTNTFIGMREEGVMLVRTLIELGSDKFETGYWEQEFSLGRWADKDGNIYEEVTQTIEFSGGPVIFTKLVKNETESLFEWTEKQIESYL